MNREAGTIFALSSGAGRSGVAVIRISGPKVRFVAETMAGCVPPARRAALCALTGSNGELLDRALVLFFAGPESFTGEDVLEFHVHGGRAVISDVLSALGSLEGLQAAEPGAFARRAFENGKLDLTAAEGLADLIDAETAAQRRMALVQSGGALGAAFAEMRGDVLRLRGLAEAAIDFSDEGDVPGDLREEIAVQCARVSERLEGFLKGSTRARHLQDGLVVAITGAPNAGKSSLVNWLSGRDVAIVSEEAGTTRDLIEVRLDLGGVPVSVFDTAGLRKTDSRVEAEGVRRARDLASRADLIVHLIDSGTSRSPDESIMVDKMKDNAGDTEIWAYRSRADMGDESRDGLKRLSVLSGEGLEGLLSRLEAFAADRAGFTGEAVLTRQRHREAVVYALHAIKRAQDGLSQSSFELVAEDLRQASDELGRMIGAIHTEDVLGEIFSAFCIGK